MKIIFKKFAEFWHKNYRPIIYLAAFLCVLFGLLSDKTMKDLNVSPAVSGIFERIENLEEIKSNRIVELEKRLEQQKSSASADSIALEQQINRLKMNPKGVLLICVDFDPGSGPELKPMVTSVIRHAFAKDIKVLGNVAYNVMSTQLADNLMREAAERIENVFPDKIAGEDYIFFGYRPNAFQVYLQMGEDIYSAYETDYAGTQLAKLPIMQNIRKFTDIDIVVAISGYVGAPEMWINVAKTKFNIPVGIGMTAVSASDYFPYLQSKQICGLLAGMRGAAEYETMLIKKYPAVADSVELIGIKLMQPQLYAHALAIFLLVLGNVEFIISKLKRKKA